MPAHSLAAPGGVRVFHAIASISQLAFDSIRLQAAARNGLQHDLAHAIHRRERQKEVPSRCHQADARLLVALELAKRAADESWADSSPRFFGIRVLHKSAEAPTSSCRSDTAS